MADRLKPLQWSITLSLLSFYCSNLLPVSAAISQTKSLPTGVCQKIHTPDGADTTIPICLPQLPGPYRNIGVKNLHMVDEGRLDPLSYPVSNSHYREMMLSIYYPSSLPTLEDRRQGDEDNSIVRHPYFITPSLGEYLSFQWNISAAELGKLQARSWLDASIIDAFRVKEWGHHTKPKGSREAVSPQVLIFSHGLGISRLAYTSLCEQLASWGFVVVAMDHPYDANVVEFPLAAGGKNSSRSRTTYGRFEWFKMTVEELALLSEVRVNDTLFVLQDLYGLGGNSKRKEGGEVMRKGSWGNSKIWNSIPGFSVKKGRLDQDIGNMKIGMWGHSFGGSTAANVLVRLNQFPRIFSKVSYLPLIGGANFDGSFSPKLVLNDGTKIPQNAPFLFFSYHRDRKLNQTEDGTWPIVYNRKEGYKKWIQLGAGARHLTFSDYPLWIDLLKIRGKGILPPELEVEIGGLGGVRSGTVIVEYVKAFWEYVFQRESGLPGGEAEKLLRARDEKRFPEVYFYEEVDD